MSSISAPNTLKKKLYQLVISRLDGENISSGSYQKRIFEFVERGIGGFIIFGGEKDEVKYFIDKIQSVSEIQLSIASDVERGVAQQIGGSTIFPCQMAVAAAIDRNRPEDVAILENAVGAIAEEAKDVGINMPLIPVLDVNQNPDNPIICTRAFSDDPAGVSWFGSEYIRILERSGLMSCAKHFPGHGDTSTDSHISLPVIGKSYGDLMNVDIAPFKEAVNAGVSSIMLGHLMVPAIDDKAATLSKKIITGILREELGFDGLIMTDALNMNAVKDIKKLPVKCIRAGADILLHPLDADLTVKELLSAIESRDISEDQIDLAISRILKIKKKIRHDKQKKFSYKDHEKLSSLISEMSITIVKNTAGILPIPGRDRSYLFLSGDDKFFGSSPLKNYFRHVFTVKEDSFRKLISDKTAIIAIFTSVAAWKGSSGIDEDEKNRINEIVRNAKNSVVISLGSPYVLRHFGEADLLIAAYEPTGQAQRAVVKCLKGERDFKGRLPVKLNI